MATVTITLDDSMKDALEDPFYSTANMERLNKSITQLNARKGTEHELIEAE
ncbi:MAG: hypothetical protein IJP89_03290 [Synergistaceae bacterium]|nr:hypothetical protein [Synergistaceae bacterium]MBR0150369.1 hypothetical protein [Synergistaceae bacterium]MBR0257402.1 hypothetical protein [Synergistaceae bacterium]